MRAGGIFNSTDALGLGGGDMLLGEPCWEGAAWDEKLGKCVGSEGLPPTPSVMVPPKQGSDPAVQEAYVPPITCPAGQRPVSAVTNGKTSWACLTCGPGDTRCGGAASTPATTTTSSAVAASSNMTLKQALPYVIGAAVVGVLMVSLAKRK